MADGDVTAKAGAGQPANEIWQNVPSELGVMASSWGRVLLAPRYAPMPSGGFRAYLPKPITGCVTRAHKGAKHEYRHVMVRREGDEIRQAPRKVHQLVCEAFHGPKPFEAAVVIHIDEDAMNNRPENLRWGTQKENLNMPKYKASKLAAPLAKTCDGCGEGFRRRDAKQRFCCLMCFNTSKSKKNAPEVRA